LSPFPPPSLAVTATSEADECAFSFKFSEFSVDVSDEIAVVLLVLLVLLDENKLIFAVRWF
jgi:hypothetical protein